MKASTTIETPLRAILTFENLPESSSGTLQGSSHRGICRSTSRYVFDGYEEPIHRTGKSLF
jgi:hypothetical protein